MSDSKPSLYQKLYDNYPHVTSALESLGKTVRDSGPIPLKETHLVQLAGAAAIQSEGGVHSHTKQALEAGATREELEHSILLLISTIGFPRTAAALSWVYDVIDNKS